MGDVPPSFAEVNLVQVALKFELARFIVCHPEIILLVTHITTKMIFRVVRSIALCACT